MARWVGIMYASVRLLDTSIDTKSFKWTWTVIGDPLTTAQQLSVSHACWGTNIWTSTWDKAYLVPMQWSCNNSPLVGHHNYPLVVQNGGMGLHLQVVHGQAYISVPCLYKLKPDIHCYKFVAAFGRSHLLTVVLVKTRAVIGGYELELTGCLSNSISVPVKCTPCTCCVSFSTYSGSQEFKE